MTTADVDQHPAVTPSTFSSTNLALLAIWVELVAETTIAAADAWIRAHSAFVQGDGYVTRLLVTPASDADEAVLRGEQPTIEAVLTRHAGHRPNNVHRSTLEVEIRPASDHPGLERQAELSAALDDAIAAAEPGNNHLADLIAMRDALQDGRVGLAGSASVGRYDVVIAASLTDDERIALERRMQSVSDALHARSKQIDGPRRMLFGNWINNYAPVAVELSTATALTRLPRARPPEERDVIVGVITPGGSAAPRDVLGKLEQLVGVSLQTATVRRGDPALTASMVRAVDVLCLSAPAAIVVGYGGGEREQLDQVIDALQVALANRTVPMYVGVGHRNYERALDSPLVRMCATPADAAELFRIEVLDIPRRRADLVARASADLLLAVGDPGQSSRLTATLAGQLDQLQLELARAHAAHGQPTQN